MTVAELQAALSLEVLVEGDMTREVSGGYCGDLLSWVMGRARSGDAWITVMGNVNAIAVCVLADTACLILSDASPLDDAARARAQAEEIPVLRSDKNTYTLAVELSRLLPS
ncbi:MAG: hypothetical protein IKA63_05425 [Clostridia bacterium]|nr:hypothetical protein [Clostridia bacterium]